MSERERIRGERPCPIHYEPGATALYRAFNSNDVLLYVGITGMGVKERGYYHALEKRWWREEVTHTVTTWYRRRSEAVLAEDLAIWEENPVRNIKRPRRPPWLPPDPWDDADWFVSEECRSGACGCNCAA